MVLLTNATPISSIQNKFLKKKEITCTKEKSLTEQWQNRPQQHPAGNGQDTGERVRKIHFKLLDGAQPQETTVWSRERARGSLRTFNPPLSWRLGKTCKDAFPPQAGFWSLFSRSRRQLTEPCVSAMDTKPEPDPRQAWVPGHDSNPNPPPPLTPAQTRPFLSNRKGRGK